MMPRRSRASSPEQARRIKLQGHRNETDFAVASGMPENCWSIGEVPQAKTDVIDPSGESHSLKSGAKKWQIFLYARNRFNEDIGFQTLDGIGELLVRCIDVFPPSFDEYRQNPVRSKQQLCIPMRELKNRLQDKDLLKDFLQKSLFNGEEVDYLTVLHEERFHVFLNSDVVQLMGDAFEVTNSKAQGNTPPEQKVLFRHNGINVGELEMRNDSPQHYQEIRFNMVVPRAVSLLFTITPSQTFNNRVMVHGGAIPKFGNWRAGWRG